MGNVNQDKHAKNIRFDAEETISRNCSESKYSNEDNKCQQQWTILLLGIEADKAKERRYQEIGQGWKSCADRHRIK